MGNGRELFYKILLLTVLWMAVSSAFSAGTIEELILGDSARRAALPSKAASAYQAGQLVYWICFLLLGMLSIATGFLQWILEELRTFFNYIIGVYHLKSNLQRLSKEQANWIAAALLAVSVSFLGAGLSGISRDGLGEPANILFIIIFFYFAYYAFCVFFGHGDVRSDEDDDAEDEE